jgi:hypothetical protein
LRQNIDESGLDLRRAASIGFDGASVMTGELGGVGTLMKKEQPFAKSHHDAAHREALACGDAVESASPWEQSKLIEDTEREANDIVSDHNRSAKRIKLLAGFQASCGLRVVRLTHGCITRWLTRHQMMNGVHSSIAALAQEYEEEGNMARLNMIMCARFIIISGYHADLTQKLSVLSKILHVDHIKYQFMRTAVKACQSGVTETYLSGKDFPGGIRMQKLKKPIEAALADESAEFCLYGRKTKLTADQWEKMKKSMETYSRSIVDALEKRFPPVCGLRPRASAVTFLLT